MSQEIDFTKSTIQNLPEAASGKRDYYIDSNKKSDHLKGFGLVVNDKGRKHFVLTQYFKRDKKTVRLRCGEFPFVTVESARTKAEGFQAMLKSGDHPTEVRNKKSKDALLAAENERLRSIRLDTVLSDYLKHRELKDTTREDYRKVVLEVWADWMDRPLLGITDDLVKDRYRKRLRTSTARANYNMRVLRALFNFARVEYKLPDGSIIFERNPVDVLSEGKTWHKVSRKKRIITKFDLGAWMNAVDQIESKVTAAYLKFLLYTGARRGEAARLLVDDVDFTANVFTLRDTKNGSDVMLPMSSQVRETLKGVISKGEKWVFRSPLTDGYIVNPRKTMTRVTELSGVEFDLHDLRRTFITTAEGLDISYYAIKALVNHKSGANTDVTEGYLDISQDQDRLLRASQRIADTIHAYASAESASKVLQFKN